MTIIFLLHHITITMEQSVEAQHLIETNIIQTRMMTIYLVHSTLIVVNIKQQLKKILRILIYLVIDLFQIEKRVTMITN